MGPSAAQAMPSPPLPSIFLSMPLLPSDPKAFLKYFPLLYFLPEQT
ncbi:hypothetical protein E2C01_093220 [Portunus trituberculatus]|uniref:Uncharacterized protein n=1 Tax=Portunus trituberculatus TaxID=210409 RepID=A0A5B7JP78_PORTR|nr:hypothetical protein [Portunus trituberculatus]